MCQHAPAKAVARDDEASGNPDHRPFQNNRLPVIHRQRHMFHAIPVEAAHE